MNKIVFYLMFVTVLIGMYGCEKPRVSSTEEQMLKVMTYEKVSESTRSFFNATYDPRESRLMRHDEIEKFLKKARITSNTLPDSLQKALTEQRAVGLLVSRWRPLTPENSQPTPKKLDETNRMLLQWETSLDHEYGTGALWFNENTECPGGKKKCADYYTCCQPCAGCKFCLCIGWYRCPPCQDCKKCESGSGVAHWLN